jgi:hypothetical protein
MNDGQEYELETATYPLLENVDAGVPIPAEIQCLLDAGWTWDGDKLVHPKARDIWRKYQRIDSPRIRSYQLDAEIEQAVREARQRGEQMGSDGQ